MKDSSLDSNSDGWPFHVAYLVKLNTTYQNINNQCPAYHHPELVG